MKKKQKKVADSIQICFRPAKAYKLVYFPTISMKIKMAKFWEAMNESDVEFPFTMI